MHGDLNFMFPTLREQDHYLLLREERVVNLDWTEEVPSRWIVIGAG